jgi:hypothetical protein
MAKKRVDSFIGSAPRQVIANYPLIRFKIIKSNNNVVKTWKNAYYNDK